MRNETGEKADTSKAEAKTVANMAKCFDLMGRCKMRSHVGRKQLKMEREKFIIIMVTDFFIILSYTLDLYIYNMHTTTRS